MQDKLEGGNCMVVKEDSVVEANRIAAGNTEVGEADMEVVGYSKDLVVLGAGTGSAVMEICSDSVAKEVYPAVIHACSGSVVVHLDLNHLTVRCSDSGLEKAAVVKTKNKIWTVVC